MQLTFEKGSVDRPLPNNCHFIENPKASLIYWYDNSHVSHPLSPSYVEVEADILAGCRKWDTTSLI